MTVFLLPGGVLTALARGDRFGIIAITHQRQS
jgi:hypothetical protein